MKLIACGYNGCVYDNGNSVVKVFNITKCKLQKEVLFGDYVNKYKDKYNLCLIPLLTYELIPGSVKIPIPPGFDLWSEKDKTKWKRNNEGNSFHAKLTYPKITYKGKVCTFKSVYWTITQKQRYSILIEFLKTIKHMHKFGWYDADIHSNNILIGDTKPFAFIIDYGEITNDETKLRWSLLELLNTFSQWPEFQIYPNDHKPIYDSFKEIKKKLRETELYKKKIVELTAKYGQKEATEIILEMLWWTDLELAKSITGYSLWLTTQPSKIKAQFSNPHSLGILPEDIIYCLEHLDNINLIIRRLTYTLAKKLLY